MDIGDRYITELMHEDGSVEVRVFEVVEVRPDDGVVIAQSVQE